MVIVEAVAANASASSTDPPYVSITTAPKLLPALVIVCVFLPEKVRVEPPPILVAELFIQLP